MYAIIDIETTGGSPVTEKLTEIAIIVYDGQKVIEEYATLINPEKKIPYYISALTGITNAMVADAPKFYEIARKIVEITENCIFVAHNVAFDYQFIRNEYKRLGYEYSREKLCTVQLSRKLIPGLPSYSLGKLCKQIGIEIKDRHRASGDADATLKLFEILLNTCESQQKHELLTRLNKKDLHPNLDPNFINNLPEETGTYYFFNDSSDLIYIGKSKNIRDRVLSHFRNFSSKKSIEMRNSIAYIDFELTGNELIALLKESQEIKQHQPLFNRAQRRALSNYGLYYSYDKRGYICFSINKNTIMNNVPLCSFSTIRSGKLYLNTLVDEYCLCQRLCGLYSSTGSCFSHEIGTCMGACIGKEMADDYNIRAKAVIESFRFKYENFFILVDGRKNEEIGVIQVDSGKYIGYGYVDSVYAQCNVDELRESISRYDDNREIQQILRHYIQVHPYVKILPYSHPDSIVIFHENKFIKEEEFPD
jgi:DNA polymerase-3 subunit epsilon